MIEIKPSEMSIDYNIALGDIKALVEGRMKRGWNHLNILDSIIAVGREGIKQINLTLEDMAEKLEKQKDLTNPPV